ncbi:Structure-specific endonuclease subunit SLX1-like protein, partial [Cucurbita argyrosperma subsp. argyrosperma]
MRKRKEKPDISEATAVAEEEEKEDDEDEGSGNKSNGFFSCYLLASVCPCFKGHTYIGFTVNPKRRIRQHNGEIRCGTWRTKRKRP